MEKAQRDETHKRVEQGLQMLVHYRDDLKEYVGDLGDDLRALLGDYDTMERRLESVNNTRLAQADTIGLLEAKLAEARKDTERHLGRRALVCRGEDGRYHARHVEVVEYAMDRDRMVYHCDEPLGSFDTLHEAIDAAGGKEGSRRKRWRPSCGT